jgi:metallo-beta-lactamase family protein
VRGTLRGRAGKCLPETPLASIPLARLRYNKCMKTFSPTTSFEPAVTFHGAARSVTGSMHLVEFGSVRLLLDCGLVRGPRDEPRSRRRDFPFDPAGIDAVLLSHSHVDHCGNLPNLIRQGFRGPIYCTPVTRDLAAIMLNDAARIHEEDAVVAGIVGSSPGAGPLFTRSDTGRTLDLCAGVPYDQSFTPAPGCQARFLDAGHILGSAIVALTLSRGGRTWRLTFTGDLGRRGLPFVREPTPVPAADLVITESTYGGRVHDTPEMMAQKVSDVVRRTVARGGRVLIPAFSLGRTQVVLHYLRQWMRDGVLPDLPLYVDSPLAAEISHVYARYRHLLAATPANGAGHVETGSARPPLPNGVNGAACRNGDGADGPPVHYVASHDESRELAAGMGPCVVIASGGMCEGGRIMPHLKHHLDDPRSSVLLVSYQAPHTIGAQLLEQRPTVRFHGRRWNKWAEVVHINGFSGHADHNDFLALLGPAAAETRRVRLVHGELPQAEALAGALRAHGFADVAVPERQERVAV